MRLTKRLTIAAAAATAALAPLAGPAHADEQGFLDALHATGNPLVGLYGDDRLLYAGLSECAKMRGGMTPEQVAGGASWIMRPAADGFVPIVQQHLCPDTM